ncbi:trypsin-like peptidase [Litorimonas taeanensis]|uniref:Trypsin-like peptidase n=1 Tax=Litorimonas taeanensis TaxID=568099 RepID=A0A420WL37_9PROT|nr:serine protease [Litorimonas taeanensis]RKQ71761.1 trypsin-like peptidase [Litorimonas taeanensis]
MSFFSIFRRKPSPKTTVKPKAVKAQALSPKPSLTQTDLDVRRYFHNERGFQCYTTWFAYWGGWISAGHCVSEAMDHTPDFAPDDCTSWPDGLDAALAGCTKPAARPQSPKIGQSVILMGYPAGSRTPEIRKGTVYYERMPGQWIAHITDPDEPVVTGMSGGPVIDAQSGHPIGIIITRNSPADLNNDRDPDESADFIALASVWDTL